MRFPLLILVLSVGLAAGQSPEDYSQQASQLALEHKWSDAIELLRMALVEYPDDLELLTKLGSLLVRSGHLEQGERYLQRVLELEPGDSGALRVAGEAALSRGQLAAATRLLLESVQRSPDNAEAHHRLAFSLLGQSQEELARDHAARAVELNPLEPRFRRLYALLLEATGHHQRADEQFKVAYRLSPRDPSLLMYLGEKRLLDGQLFQALEYLELAVETDPENPVYHRKLSQIYQRLGYDAEAHRKAEEATALTRAFEKYLSAIRLSQQGAREQAIAVLEDLLVQESSFVTGMMMLADLYQKSDQQERALGWYQRVLDQDPLHSEAGESAAWIHTQKGLLDAALELLERSEIDTANHILIRAYQRMEQGDWAGALAHLRQVEKQNPLHAGLLQLIGYCQQKQGEKEQALLTLTKAETLVPDDPRVQQQVRQIRFQKAYELLEANQWRPALKAFSELLREDIQPDYLLRIGYCYQQLGELEQAVKNYKAGLEGDATATWARINLATSLYLLARYEEAALQWEQVLSREGTAEAHYQLGLCYSHLDRYPEAERMFSRALELGDQRPEVYYYLGVSRLYSNKAHMAWSLIYRAARSGFPPAQEMIRRRHR